MPLHRAVHRAAMTLVQERAVGSNRDVGSLRLRRLRLRRLRLRCLRLRRLRLTHARTDGHTLRRGRVRVR